MTAEKETERPYMVKRLLFLQAVSGMCLGAFVWWDMYVSAFTRRRKKTRTNPFNNRSARLKYW